MTTPFILDCDPGHDDAIALLLALGSPELELVGVTTVSGNQTLEKTTANAIRVLDFIGREDVPVAAGADRPLVRERRVAAEVHGESGLDMTMIGLDVTHKALMSPEHAASLRRAGRTGTMVAELFDFFSRFHREVYGMDAAPIHDAVAVAHVARPGLVETLERHVAVDCESELCRGRTVVDLWRRTGNEPNAHVGVDIDAERFIDLLLERLPLLDFH